MLDAISECNLFLKHEAIQKVFSGGDKRLKLSLHTLERALSMASKKNKTEIIFSQQLSFQPQKTKTDFGAEDLGLWMLSITMLAVAHNLLMGQIHRDSPSGRIWNISLCALDSSLEHRVWLENAEKVSHLSPWSIHLHRILSILEATKGNDPNTWPCASIVKVRGPCPLSKSPAHSKYEINK